MTTFRLPFGLDSNSCLVARPEAAKGKRYVCPNCHAPLIVREGRFRTKHFAHASTSVCSPESACHVIAKLLIASAVRAWLEGHGQRPTFDRKCQSCPARITQHLPDTVVDVAIEYRLSSGHVADLALLGRHGPVAVLEIRASHAVPETKANELSLPWGEFASDDVIAEPLSWRPIRDHLRKLACPECKKGEAVEQERLQRVRTINQWLCRKIARNFSLVLAGPPYVARPWRCYLCRLDMIVYTWPDRKMHSTTPPPKPVPATVRIVHSTSVEAAYWGNVCPHCEALQGDFYLYAGPRAPFSTNTTVL